MIFEQSEATAVRRRFWLYLVDATDGLTAETGEAAGQPQISKNGAAFGNTSATLTHIGNGTYYVELTAGEIDTLGKIMVRFKSAATAEFSMVADVVDYDPYDVVRMGMTALPNAAAEAAGGLYTRGTGAGQINQPANGQIDVNLHRWLTGTPNALNSGTVQADVQRWLNAVPSALISGRVDASAILQQAAIDAFWDEVLTGATHNVIDSGARRLRVLEENGTYGGFIWIDTIDGSAGTTDFENGTDHNPVNNIADANTLAASIGLSRFKVAPGSSLTFAAAQQNQEFSGSSWTLALGGQDIANSTIMGAEVSGVAVGTGTQHFRDCSMGAVTLPDDTHIATSDLVGTQTLPAGNVFYDRCHAGVIGTPPQFDFGVAVGSTDLHLRNYSGGVDLRNMGQSGTDEASIEGRGDVTVNANCTGGTIFIRGLFELTDNGSATITDGARYESGSLVDDIFDEDIVAAHGTADTAGLLLRALGALISQRSNNPNLDALLGVTDSAGNDIPNQILTGETLAELADAIPDATPTMAKALMLFYMMTRNKFTSTATLLQVFNDAGAVIAKKVLADDGTTYTETEAVAGT